MNTKSIIFSCLAILMLGGSPDSAQAGTAMQKALDNGATRLSADQIADKFVGWTGTWISSSGDKKIEIYYGKNNDLSAEKVGGGWTGNGYYGIANDDSICISWAGNDKGRLRCLDVLIVDGVVTKFNVDGSPNGSYEKFMKGKTF